MHAWPRGAEEGTFEVDAQDAAAWCREDPGDSDRAGEGVEVGGNQRGQDRGGAEAAMGRRDVAGSVRGRVIVELDPATAIDLTIDQAGGEQAVGREGLATRGWRGGGGQGGGDNATLDQHAEPGRGLAVGCQRGAAMQENGLHGSAYLGLQRFA